jgi:hypothetical protein
MFVSYTAKAGVILLLLSQPCALGAQRRLTPPVDSAGTPCSSGLNGSVMLSERAQALFALDLGADSAAIVGVVIARSQSGWRGFFGTDQPIPPQPSGGPWAGGGTVDTLWLQIDGTHRLIAIQNHKVPLGDNNVLLVDRVDGVGGPAQSVGALRVRESFGLPTRCRVTPSPAVRDSMRALLLGDARVRDFVRP